MRIDLLSIGASTRRPEWELGVVHEVSAQPDAVQRVIEREIRTTQADAWLFWDSGLAPPDPVVLEEYLDGPADVWHAGLRLGMAGQPAMLTYVFPTWLLNADPDPTKEATSWRLTLRACLVRTAVLRQLGGIASGFRSLEGASLELGHRYIAGGAIPRHAPALLSGDNSVEAPFTLPLVDELRFLYYRFGGRWMSWAVARAIMSGDCSISSMLRAWRTVLTQPRPFPTGTMYRANAGPARATVAHRISVIVPTLGRYSHLRSLLGQLRAQSIRPWEVIVVDQTPLSARDQALARDFVDLPLVLVHRDEPGQCSSRNAAFDLATGDLVLLLDDDVEIGGDFLAGHVNTLHQFRCSVASGAINEIGVDAQSTNGAVTRVSDVFPAGNTLLRREALERTGGFDLAYERGARADADLGIRLYLAGNLMILNQDVYLHHHRAPRGGLRHHRARLITYASSRTRLTHRRIPEPTEFYLALRYFGPKHARELAWIAGVGTLAGRGGTIRRMLKLAWGILMLPSTALRISHSKAVAERMLATFPQIPEIRRRG